MNDRPKVKLILDVGGEPEGVEIRIDQRRVDLDASGTAQVHAEVGHHFLQYVCVGAPGRKFSLRIRSERGEDWVRIFRLPGDGTVVGSKKFSIVPGDEDDWPGPRFAP